MKNKYQEGLNILFNSDLELKAIKEFEGREGIGASANIYWKGKQVGTYLDEANGGEEWIDYESQEMNDFLKSLPKFSHNEWLIYLGEKPIKKHNRKVTDRDSGKVTSFVVDNDIRNEGWKWYWANALRQRNYELKLYKKWLRKVVIFDKNANKIVHYKTKSSCLKEIQYKLAFNQIVNKGDVILNELPQDKAFEYLDKYVPRK